MQSDVATGSVPTDGDDVTTTTETGSGGGSMMIAVVAVVVLAVGVAVGGILYTKGVFGGGSGAKTGEEVAPN